MLFTCVIGKCKNCNWNEWFGFFLFLNLGNLRNLEIHYIIWDCLLNCFWPFNLVLWYRYLHEFALLWRIRVCLISIFFFFSFLNVTIQDCSDTRWRVMEETDEFRIDGDCIKNWGRCWTRWKISQLFLFFFNVCFGNNIIDFWIRNWFLSSMQLF